MKVFPIKETFFQRYVYSKFIPAKRQETWEIIKRHDGTNNVNLCPGKKVRVQFYDYSNKFMMVKQRSVNANGTFVIFCVIMIHGVNYWFCIKAHKHREPSVEHCFFLPRHWSHWAVQLYKLRTKQKI